MKKEIKHLSLRLNPEVLKKFDYVAKYEDRSKNWMLNKLVNNCIAKFENKHGKIEFDETEEKGAKK